MRRSDEKWVRADFSVASLGLADYEASSLRSGKPFNLEPVWLWHIVPQARYRLV